MTATVDLDYDLIARETPEAVEFILEEGLSLDPGIAPEPDKRAWIPRSQIASIDERAQVVTVSQWFADKEGLT